MSHPSQFAGFCSAAFLPLVLALATACAGPGPKPDHGRALPDGAPALLPWQQWPDLTEAWQQRQQVLAALQNSLGWMDKPSAQRRFPIAGIDHARARASLERLELLLQNSPSAAAFTDSMRKEFDLFISAGWNGAGGGVLFTGYCTPVLEGSLTRDSNHRFPLYGLPDDLVKSPEGEVLGRKTATGLTPYPSRREIETRNLLAGRELVWLRTPLDAYLAHVNGSAYIKLPDGKKLLLGYAGQNGHEYTSLRQALIAQGTIDKNAPGLSALRAWSAATPEAKVQDALRKNARFVFFLPSQGAPTGSLGLPVSAGRSLATDKRLFPPGAAVLVQAALPDGVGGRARSQVRLMLDQDTGGAIRTAGRADVYVGSGLAAERSSGELVVEGQLYYFFLKPSAVKLPLP